VLEAAGLWCSGNRAGGDDHFIGLSVLSVAWLTRDTWMEADSMTASFLSLGHTKHRSRNGR
jgi:hypothetical protein